MVCCAWREMVVRLEKWIVREIMAWLRKNGFWCFKLWGQTAGMPDIVAIRNGKAYWFEVKNKARKATPIQEHILSTLRSYGCVAEVVRSIEDVERALAKDHPPAHRP